jgi:hypothetical protein
MGEPAEADIQIFSKLKSRRGKSLPFAGHRRLWVPLASAVQKSKTPSRRASNARGAHLAELASMRAIP